MNEYQKQFDLFCRVSVLWVRCLVVSWFLEVLPDDLSDKIGTLYWKDWVMKITTYQENARMLWEAHRVIHQQNMQRLAELNHHNQHQQKDPRDQNSMG
jgi:hypothetical protein